MEESYNIDLTKFKELIVNPKKLFSKLESEKRYLPLVVQVNVLYFIFIAASAAYSYWQGAMNVYGIVVALIYSIIIATISLFAISGIIHLGVISFKRNSQFFRTFQVVGYAWTLFVFYSYLTLILALIFPIDAGALSNIAYAGFENFVLLITNILSNNPGILVNLVVFLAAFVHIVIFLIFGIHKMQKLSKLKAAGSVILPWVALILLYLIIFSLNSAATNPF